MTFMDTVLRSMQKGYDRIQQGAALFAERMRFELNLVRTRARIAGMRGRIDELHAGIGRRALQFASQDPPPKTFLVLLSDEEVSAALQEIERLSREIEELAGELSREDRELAEVVKQAGEKDE